MFRTKDIDHQIFGINCSKTILCLIQIVLDFKKCNVAKWLILLVILEQSLLFFQYMKS